MGWWRRVCEKSEEIAAILGEKLRVLVGEGEKRLAGRLVGQWQSH